MIPVIPPMHCRVQTTLVVRLRPFALTMCGLLFAAKIASGGTCDLQVSGHGKDASGDYVVQLSASIRLRPCGGSGHWGISQTSGPVGKPGFGCDGSIGGNGEASGTCSWTFSTPPAEATSSVSFRLGGGGGYQYCSDNCESVTLPTQLGEEGPTPPPPSEGAIQYHHVDALGSLRAVTNDKPEVVSRTDYLPFGEMIPPNVPSTTFRLPTLQYGGEDSVHHRFTGQFYDEESQLDYFGARYFSSQQGRWMSPDQPFADQHVEDPQSWNLYAYARNIPTRLIDLDGREVGEGIAFLNNRTELAKRYGEKAGADYQRRHWQSAAPAAAFGGAVALGALAANAPALLTGLTTVFADPAKQQMAAEVVDGLFNPGPSWSLSGNLGRLSKAELSTGVAFAEREGLHLEVSTHVGEEFIDAAGKTYDAMGSAKAFEHWKPGEFMASITDHVRKSADYVILDVRSASSTQFKQIQTYVGGLAKEAQEKIKYLQ